MARLWLCWLAVVCVVRLEHQTVAVNPESNSISLDPLPEQGGLVSLATSQGQACEFGTLSGG